LNGIVDESCNPKYFWKPDPEDQSNIALNTEAQYIWIRLLWMLI
jgi:hypothetical protein